MLSRDLSVISNPFQFEGFDVRVATDAHGETWWCAKDVCAALDVTWNAKTLKNHPESWSGVRSFLTPGGVQDMVFVNLPGLFRLILRSNKPSANKFQEWVCGEVLPALFRNGFFGTIPPDRRIIFSKQIQSLCKDLQTTHDALAYDLLTGELRVMCSLAGVRMPDLERLGKDYRQLPLSGL